MSRKRWIKRALAGFLALGATGTVTGCKQQTFLEPDLRPFHVDGEQ